MSHCAHKMKCGRCRWEGYGEWMDLPPTALVLNNPFGWTLVLNCGECPAHLPLLIDACGTVQYAVAKFGGFGWSCITPEAYLILTDQRRNL